MCPSFNIIKEYILSESEFASILRWMGGKAPTQLGLFNRVDLIYWTMILKTDPVSKPLCSFTILDDGQSPQTQ
jgi:hypothetical protein